MSVDEVASELAINPETVRVWLRTGRLAGVRAGGRKWRVRRSELGRMLTAGTAHTAPAAGKTGAHVPSTKRPGERVITTIGERPERSS